MQWLPPLFQMHQIPESSLKNGDRNKTVNPHPVFSPTNKFHGSVPRTAAVLTPRLCT